MKKIALILVFIFSTCLNVNVYATSTLKPSLALQSIPKLEVSAGAKSGEINVPVINRGNDVASNIIVTHSSSNNSLLPFVVTYDGKLSNINASDTSNLKVIIEADKNAAAGQYGINLDFSYFGSDGVRYNDVHTVYVTVINNAALGKLIIEDISATNSTMGAGGTSTLNVHVRNNTSSEIRGATATINGLDSNGLHLNSGIQTRNIDVIGSGNRSVISFDIRASSNMSSGSYPVSIALNYTKSDGTTERVEETYYLVVVASSQESIVPLIKMQFSSITSDKQTVAAGGTATLTVRVQNTSAAEARDLNVTIEGLDPQGVSIQNGVSTKRFGTLAPLSEGNVTFNIVTSPSMSTGNYPITFTAKCVNSKDEATTISQTYFVNVEAPKAADRNILQLTDFSADPSGISVGEKTTISFSVKNIGTTDVSAIKIGASGMDSSTVAISDGVAVKSISQLNAGRSQKITYTFVAGNNPGSYPISFSAKYVDATGQDVLVEQVYYLTVLEAEDLSKQAPNIKLAVTPVFSENVGSSEISLEFANESEYNANSVSFYVFDDPADPLPFVVSIASSVNSIEKNKSGKVVLQLDISTMVVSKTYAVPIRFSYKNESGYSFSGEEIIYIRVKNDNVTSALEITDFYSDAILAGGSGRITAYIFNNGSAALENLTVTLDGLQTEAISISGGTNQKSIKKIESGFAQQISFDISAASALAEGNYPVTFVVEYTNNMGLPQIIEQVYYVHVYTDPLSDGSKLKMSSLTMPKGFLGAEETFNISFTLSNVSSMDATDLKISAIPPSDGTVFPLSETIITEDVLGVGEAKTYSYTFGVGKSANSQSYLLGFTVEYTDAVTDGEAKRLEQYAGVYVRASEADEKEEDTTKNTPKIIISRYECAPLIVSAGSSFDLSMTYENTNTIKSVRNVKVYLTSTEIDNTNGSSIFTPVNSSNTFYIDSMPPKGTVDKMLQFYAAPDAQPKTYTIAVNFEYEDGDGNEYATTEIIGINVAQPSKLETSEIIFPEMSMMYNQIYMQFDMYNTGRVPINNLIVRVEGNFDSPSRSMFFGKLESGASNYFECSLSPNTPGEQIATLIITYDEPTGEHKEIVQEFLTYVEDMPMFESEFPGDENPDMFLPEEEKGLLATIKKILANKFVWAGAAVVIIAAVVTIVLLVRRNTKKKKELMLDE